MRRLLAVGGVFFVLAWASIAHAQYYIGTVTTAAVNGGPYSPGQTISLPFILAPGTTAAARVDFNFSCANAQQTYSKTLSTTNPAGGLASATVDGTWPNGTYTLASIRVTDTLGDYIDYDSSGVANVTDSHGWYLPASTSQASYAGVSFTVTGGLAAVTAPVLTSCSFANSSVAAGNPISVVCAVQPGSINSWTLEVELAGPGLLYRTQTITGTGSGTGTVSFPTDATATNGSYSIANVFIGDGLSTTFYSPGDGTGLLSSTAVCTLTGGLDLDQVAWPQVTGIQVPSGPFTLGQSIDFSVAVTAGSAPISSVTMQFQSPDATVTGAGPTVTASGTGPLVATIGSDWPDGTYSMTSIEVLDADGRAFWITPRGNYFNEIWSTDETTLSLSANTLFSVAGALSYPTVITGQPQGGTVQPGQSLGLYFTFAGAGPVEIQWFIGQPGDTSHPIPGANSSYFEPGSPSSTTTYWAQVTTGGTVTDSAAATITVDYPSPQPAIISGSDANNDLQVGDEVDLSAFAVGPAPLTYAWYKDGVLIPGATTAILIIPSAQLSDSGNYTLVVSNAYGSATAGPFSVTIMAPPQITLQPANQTVAYGGTVTLSVTATGGNLEYQWYFTDAMGVSSSPESSQIYGPTLTISNVQPNYAGTYTVLIWNSDGRVTSAPAILSVTNVPPPQFSQVSNQYGQVNVAYNWGFTATNFPLQYAASGLPPGLTIDPASGAISGIPTTAGTYPVTLSATNDGGTTQVAYTITIEPGTYGPIFTQQPASLTVAAGEQVTLSASAVGTPGYGGLVCQWYLGSTPLQGANGLTYAFTASAATAGTYSVQVWGAGGTATSSPAVITLDPSLSVPASAAVPDQTVAAGGSITLSFPVTGTGPLTYQWTLPGYVTGPTTATCLIQAANAGNDGQYFLQVKNAYGQATFTQALHVQYAPQPAAATIYPGQSVTLSVPAASGVNFQWYQGASGDESHPVTGATQATFTTPPLTASTSYWVSAIDAPSEDQSAASVITVNSSLAAYAGTYFGTLSGGGGWAMVLGPDGTGEFLGYAGPNEASYGPVAIGADGSFTATQGQSASPGGGPARFIKAPVVSGSISGGTVTGTFGTSSMTGALDQGNGSAISPGTFVVSGLNGSTADGYAIVGPDGKAAIIVDTGTGAIGVSGTANASGAVAATDGSGNLITAQGVENGVALAIDVVEANGATFSLGGLVTGAPSTARLLNLSARENVGTGANVGAIGFVVGGTGSMNALIRGVGPSLAAFGVSGYLAQPALTVFDQNSNPLWVVPTGDAAGATANTAIAVGAFALQPGAADAADVINLDPGRYSAVLSGVGGTEGIAMAELYQASMTGSPRLLNLSARGSTGPGAATLTAGLVVGGNAPETVLLRGIGPTLTSFGVTGAITDPVLFLYGSGQQILASNAGWGGSQALENAFNTVGAFMLPATSADSAMLVTLLPGSYTVQVQSAAGSTGVALVEVYEMPSN